MKIALLTDLHFGVGDGNLIVLEHQQKFYETVFFPAIIKFKIEHLVILGDTFDKRKYTNNFIIDRVKRFFFDRLQEMGITTYIIVGNHDTSFKHTLFPNTIDSLLPEYTNITVINTPRTIQIGSNPICMIPWICSDNSDACYQEMATTKSDICFGHFEISGFKMYKHSESIDGLDRNLFNRFDLTLSGHYHHKSTQSNIAYLGTSYEMSWNDYGDQKGFHLLDLDNNELTYIQSPYHLFVKIEYNDENDLMDPSVANQAIVKLIVTKKTDHYRFETYMQSLYKNGAYDVKVIEDIGDFTGSSIEVATKLEDTQSLLSQFVDATSTDVDKEKIKQFLQSLYTEAINMSIT